MHRRKEGREEKKMNNGYGKKEPRHKRDSTDREYNSEK
jgi:hypothetical protein